MQSPLKGSLAETGFIEILKEAADSKLTGMVRVENGSVIKVGYLQQGSIAFASSNEKSDRLTEVLKRAGKLTPEQIEHAQARLKPNVSLGKTLVELGYISAKDLLWGARTQVESILHQLLFWNAGNYQILEGALPKEIVSLNIPVSQIIYDGILKTQDRQWVLDHIESPQAIYNLGPDFHEANAVYKLPVENLISRLNGKRTLEEVAQSAGLDTFEVCKTIVALQVLNLVQRTADKPESVPVMVEEEEQVMRVSEQMVTVPAAENLSLGQMMQIPTVQELQQTPGPLDESMEEVETPAIEEREEPEEVQKEPEPFESAIAPQAEPEAEIPTIQVAPPALSVRQPSSPEIPFEFPKAEAPPSVAEEKAQEQEPFEEEPFEAHSEEPREAPVPMQDFSYARRSYPQHSEFNWRTMAMIMATIIVVLIGGFWLYSRFLRQGAQETTDVSQTVAPRPKPVAQAKPPEAKPAARQQQVAQNTTSAVTQKPAAIQPKTPAQPTPSQQSPSPALQRTPAALTSTSAATPGDLLRQGKIPDAAKLWDAALRKQRNAYTIQLEIACQAKTVMEAINMTASSKDLIVVPLNYKGQSCYRVLYGVYSTDSSARTARAKLPQDFLKQPSPAQVVPLTKILK